MVLAAAGTLVLAGAGTAAVIALRPAPLPAVSTVATPAPSATPSAAQAVAELEAGTFTGIKPVAIYLSADGTGDIGHISWQSWTADKAVGTGTKYLNNCIPNCAQGTQSQVSATLVFSNPVGGFFTELVVTAAGQVTEYQASSANPSTYWPLGAQPAGSQ